MPKTDRNGPGVAWRARHFIAAVVLALWVGPAGASAELRVIANPDLPVSEISAADLKSVFLLNKSVLGGKSVSPVLQAGALGAFSGEYLGKTFQAVETYFRSRVFAGQGSMPLRFLSDADVIAHVAKTPGAIGYVSGEAPLTGVKTLRVR